MVATIDDGDLDFRAPQRPRSVEPTKAGANNHDVRLCAGGLRLSDAPVSDFALGGHGKVQIDGNTSSLFRPLLSDRAVEPTDAVD